MNTREQNGDFETFCKIVDKTIMQFADDVVTQLGYRAFAYCGLLTSVNLPAATSIDIHAFQNCKALTSIELPVASGIGRYAFDNCNALAKVVLPSVTSISEYVFNSCSGLTSVIIRTQSQIASLANINSFSGANNAIIYVPDDLVEEYKSATNWSALASRIKPLSELPAEE